MGNVFSLKNWLKELAFPYSYCESLIPSGPEEDSGPHLLKTRKNSIRSLERKNPQLVKSAIFSNFKFSFFAPMLFAEAVKIKCPKKAFLDFAVRFYIKKQNLFDDGFQFCYDLLDFNGEEARINLYILPGDEAHDLLNKIPHTTSPVACVAPLESVLTQILANTVKHPVVSVWADSQHVLILATKNGEILSRYVANHESNEKTIGHWLVKNDYLQSAIDSVKRQIPDQPVSVLVWGQYYHQLQKFLANKTSFQIDKALEKKIDAKLNWASYLTKSFKKNAKKQIAELKKVNKAANKANDSKLSPGKIAIQARKEALLKNPLLYGLPICQSQQTLISPDYKVTYAKLMHARHALIASLLVSLGFFAVGINKYITQQELQVNLEQKQTTIAASLKQAKSQVPSDATIDRMVALAELKTSVTTELNVTNFLGWLTNITPEKAVIDQLSIERLEDSPLLKTKQKQKQSKSQAAKQYAVAMNLRINENYPDSVKQIDEFFFRLSQKILTPQSKFTYKDENNQVPTALSINFVINPLEFY